MKKLITLTLALLAITSLTACNETKGEETSDSTYTSELIKASVLDYDKAENVKVADREDYQGLQSFEMTSQDVYNFMAVDPTVKLIDVREPSEYEAGHIEGSVLIPLGKLSPTTLEANGITPADYIILYCRSGNRSAQAYEIIYRLRYYASNSMAGGINQWIAEGLPVITD